MPVESRYFALDTPTSRNTCMFGSCNYPLGAYWNYAELHKLTLTLTSKSGTVDDIAAWGWTGTLPSVTRTTAENLLYLPHSPGVGDYGFATFPGGLDGWSIEINAADSAYPLTLRMDYDLAAGDVGYCQYGTRLKAGISPQLVVDQNLIGALIFRDLRARAIQFALSTLIGLTLDGTLVCGGPPPPMPTPDQLTFIPGTGIPQPGSIGYWLEALKAVAWDYWCECKPATGGGPTPVVYPPNYPDDSGYRNTPPPGAIVCDTGDLCTSLDAINLQLTGINATLALARRDIQLIQSQNVPFGYLPGTIHSGLTSAGDFAVSDILGLAVEVTAMPPYLTRDAADPTNFWDVGEISLGTPEGWLHRQKLSHELELIMPISGVITRVGYYFNANVTATITELRRELVR